jgi:L-threonylcarbamoyladenylate synthase
VSFWPYEFRVASPTDWQLVVAVIRAAWADRVDPRSSGHTFTVADLESLVTDAAAIVLVAREHVGSDVVATATLLRGSDPETTEICKVAVHPAVQGSGLGEALMLEALRRVTTSRSLLAISAYQPELVRWYARFGYIVSPTDSYGHASPTSPPPIVMVRSHEETTRPLDPVGEAVTALQQGRLVGMPTETVYGLAADASNPFAVRQVFAAKGRPVDHPLIVHLQSARSLATWAVANEDAQKLATAFWPGPLTMVLPRQQHVLDEVTGGRATVAVRVPRHPLALALIAQMGVHAGLVAPSANPFGAVSPTTAEHVRLDGLADLVIDGGASLVGVESTIVELISDTPQILRPGAITAADIAKVLGKAVQEQPDGPARAPGMLASHYSPKAAVRIVQYADVAAMTDLSPADEAGPVGWLGPAGSAPSGFHALDAPAPYTADTVAPIIYARLRSADDLGLSLLVVVEPREGNLQAAVADRLRRAAHQDH